MQKKTIEAHSLNHRAFIALGANLGERDITLRRALEILDARDDIRCLSVSSFYDTAPVGGPPDQPRYLNAAAEIATSLTPRDVLNVLLETERSLGRDRSSPERNQPRVVDLDLLLYDDLVLNESGLEVPHPRMHERLFVLKPLSEIAPAWVHPTLNQRIDGLLQFCQAAHEEK